MLLLAVSAEVASHKIGMTRFNFDANQKAAEISINLNPGARGLRLATPVLTQSIQFLETNVGVMPLRARLRPENTASRRAFEKTGFVYDPSEVDYDLFLRPK